MRKVKSKENFQIFFFILFSRSLLVACIFSVKINRPKYTTIIVNIKDSPLKLFFLRTTAHLIMLFIRHKYSLTHYHKVYALYNKNNGELEGKNPSILTIHVASYHLTSRVPSLPSPWFLWRGDLLLKNMAIFLKFETFPEKHFIQVAASPSYPHQTVVLPTYFVLLLQTTHLV